MFFISEIVIVKAGTDPLETGVEVHEHVGQRGADCSTRLVVELRIKVESGQMIEMQGV